MAISAEPTPIVLIGQTPRFGKVVARKLKPEFEGPSPLCPIVYEGAMKLNLAVIHFVSDIDQAKGEMQTILAGGSPPRDPHLVASGNFSQLPRHIVFGKGFQWPRLQEVREIAGNEDSKLCWYWAPIKPGEVTMTPEQVSTISDEWIDNVTNRIVGTMKDVLGNVISEGREGVDGIYTL
jgi:hypothetical protein